MLVREKGEVDWIDSKLFTEFQHELCVAEEFAKWDMWQNPRDPEDVDLTVEVLNEEGELKTFKVTAEMDVVFYAKEFEE